MNNLDQQTWVDVMKDKVTGDCHAVYFTNRTGPYGGAMSSTFLGIVRC